MLSYLFFFNFIEQMAILEIEWGLYGNICVHKHTILVSHHLRGLQGAARDEVLFARLKGVADDSYCRTPGRTRRSLTDEIIILQHPDRREKTSKKLNEANSKKQLLFVVDIYCSTKYFRQYHFIVCKALKLRSVQSVELPGVIGHSE